MAEPDTSYDERAQDLAQKGKIREALDCYDEALTINPDNDVILNNKAIALISLNKCEESLICTQRAVQINPTAVEAWINMGIALDKLGQHPEASDALEQAVLLSPYHAYARAMLGIVYQKMDMGDRAEVQNRKLQELVFPKEYAGFYFSFSALLLGLLLGGVRAVEGKSFDVSLGSQLIIFFLFCVICYLYWRSRRMWHDNHRHVITVPYQMPTNGESNSKGMFLVIIFMIVVFVIGIISGGNIRSFL
jgi:tetratricopeptide (TPR) repeat protein